MAKSKPRQTAPKLADAVKLRNEAQVADHIARIQKRDTRARVDDRYYVAARELADRLGVDVAHVIEEWNERAGCYRYEAGMTDARAEELAWLDTCARFDRQKAIAI